MGTTAGGGGLLYQRFLGGGGYLVTPQFQQGGPMAAVLHDTQLQSGRCLKHPSQHPIIKTLV